MIGWIILFIILILVIIFVFCAIGDICEDDVSFMFILIWKYLIIKPLEYIKRKLFNPIIKSLLKIKIKKIIEEINSNKEFKGCFKDVKGEVNSWNIKQIRSWKLEK